MGSQVDSQLVQRLLETQWDIILCLFVIVIIKKDEINIGEDVRKDSPCALLVEIQIGVATVENCTENTQ